MCIRDSHISGCGLGVLAERQARTCPKHSDDRGVNYFIPPPICSRSIISIVFITAILSTTVRIVLHDRCRARDGYRAHARSCTAPSHTAYDVVASRCAQDRNSGRGGAGPPGDIASGRIDRNDLGAYNQLHVGSHGNKSSSVARWESSWEESQDGGCSDTVSVLFESGMVAWVAISAEDSLVWIEEAPEVLPIESVCVDWLVRTRAL
eukprot:2116333-Pleurochrysis_carterae.AAC.1